MSAIELNVPDDLAERLRPLSADLPRILELGLRQFHAQGQPDYEGATEVIEFLATLPTPEETLAIRPSAPLQARIDELLRKNREGGLTPAEEEEWLHYEFLEHVVRLAKARARLKLERA